MKRQGRKRKAKRKTTSEGEEEQHMREEVKRGDEKGKCTDALLLTVGEGEESNRVPIRYKQHGGTPQKDRREIRSRRVNQ